MTTLGEKKEYDGQIVGTDENNKTKLIRVTNEGYSIVDDVDNAGRNSFNDVFGAQLVASRRADVSVNFSQGVEERTVKDKSTNLGLITQVGSKLSIQSGASASSSGIVESKQGLRYRAGKSFEGMFTARFSAPEIGNTRSIGLFDDTTGLAVRLIDDELNFSLKRDGAWLLDVPQSEWNADKLDGTGNSRFDLNILNLAIYRLSGGYLGVAPLTLEVFAGFENGFVEVHTIDLSNSREDTHFNYPYLALRAESINTTATGNNVVESGSASASIFDGGGNVFDPDSSSRDYTVEFGETTLLGATETVVGVFHNKDTFNGLNNKIMSRILSVDASSDGTKTVRFRIKRLLTDPTGGTWADINTSSSIMEYSTDTTVTQTQLDNASLMFGLNLAPIDSQREYIGNLNIRLYPTEYAVLTMISKNASDVGVLIRESERF